MEKWKLVRDNIPNIISEKGKTCDHYPAENLEYRRRLFDKMQEESDEFREDPSYEEAADVYEVFMTLLWLHNLDYEKVISKAIDKRNKRGGFKEKFILKIGAPDMDDWSVNSHGEQV